MLQETTERGVPIVISDIDALCFYCGHPFQAHTWMSCLFTDECDCERFMSEDES